MSPHNEPSEDHSADSIALPISEENVLDAPWQMLNSMEYEAGSERLRRWLADPLAAKGATLDIAKMASARLVQYAYSWFCRYLAAGTGTALSSLPINDLQHAASESARAFRNELRSVLASQHRLTFEVAVKLIGDLRSGEFRTNMADPLERVLERGASQLSAHLLFPNLDRLSEVGNVLWDPVLERVVCFLVIPHEARDEDSVRDCVALIVSTKFEFVCVGASVKFFQEAWRNKQREARRKVTMYVAADAELERMSGVTYISEESPDESPVGFPVVKSNFPLITARWPLSAATTFWVAHLLRARYLQSWNEIADNLRLSRGGVLSDEDLPEGLDWSQVPGLVSSAAIASGCPSGRWVPETIRGFYHTVADSLDRRTLIFERVRNLLRGRQTAIRFWIVMLLAGSHKETRRKQNADAADTLWDVLAALLRRPLYEILDPSELPVGVTFAEAETALSRYALTPTALKQFYFNSLRHFRNLQ